MAHFLVLGGRGFIGRNLLPVLTAAGHKVTALVRDRIALPGVTSLVRSSIGELTDNDIRQLAFTHCIHLAGGLIPSSGESDHARELASITVPTLALLPRLQAHGIQLVFFSSGGALYAGSGGAVPKKESDALGPISLYGRNKLLLEEGILDAHRRHELQYLILRPSNPYGSHQRRDGLQGLVAAALGRVMAGVPITIWGDGSVIRDYIYIDDLVRGVIALLDAGVTNATFNVSSGQGHSILQVVETIRLATGRPVDLIFEQGRRVDLPYQVLDRSAISAYDTAPVLPLLSGIKRYADALEEGRG